MFEKEKREILDAALEIKKCNLISLSGGNVSMRAGENLFLVTPSGMIYEEMTADDVVVIDRDCRVVEGTRKPSSDSPALVYMFEHMPHINALIHTHQPYATAAGFASDRSPPPLHMGAAFQYAPDGREGRGPVQHRGHTAKPVCGNSRRRFCTPQPAGAEDRFCQAPALL